MDNIVFVPGKFLSTLSLRRATVPKGSVNDFKLISIHALLAESDIPRSGTFRNAQNFYPRSPCGERPPVWGLAYTSRQFLSTLSLRRATAGKGPAVKGYRNFYPRSPCGERPPLRYSKTGQAKFLSTLSLRRATETEKALGATFDISIHALLAESDVMCHST